MEINLPKKLNKALEKEANDANVSLNAHIIKKLESITPPSEYIDHKVLQDGLPVLVDFLNTIPSVEVLSSDLTPDAYWWVKLNINIEHTLAWNVVQELGFVLNYISVQEPLPTVFKPVSPPPYLNGGPNEFLSWVLESTYNYIDPKWIKSMLEGRLPNPVEDESNWE
ncbi:hypothetical protein [Tenacibaculum jejuense]|uniref:Arc-like DNA binding domain-containing protein n=1 Tax=Tenacibaculum jejuense TaxID=584609 RepID=A0A238UF52_9FLAO|nr:hypothetical protein [Tenacibaculum jejuense]SNR17208.1 conserved protein of unknown function [Tenacibaculum jejuense]